MYKCIVFDLDGTLIDTFEGIDKAYQWAFARLNREYPGEFFVRHAIGAPLPQVFEKRCGMSAAETAAAVQAYRTYYGKSGKYEATVYTGMEEALRTLKAANLFLGVATLKNDTFARDILRHFSLFPYFDAIHGTDGKDTLTKADLIYRCMRDIGATETETVLVGDSPYDAQGAKAAGVDFLAVTYGFGFSGSDDESAQALKNARLAGDPRDIPALLGLREAVTDA